MLFHANGRWLVLLIVEFFKRILRRAIERATYAGWSTIVRLRIFRRKSGEIQTLRQNPLNSADCVWTDIRPIGFDECVELCWSTAIFVVMLSLSDQLKD